MGEQLRERDFGFPGLREFRPKLCDASRQPNVVLLQGMKQARAPQTFRGRPKKNNGVGRPRLFAFRIAKSAAQLHERLPMSPDRNSRAELTEAREIVFKEASDALGFHRGA